MSRRVEPLLGVDVVDLDEHQLRVRDGGSAAGAAGARQHVCTDVGALGERSDRVGGEIEAASRRQQLPHRAVIGAVADLAQLPGGLGAGEDLQKAAQVMG